MSCRDQRGEIGRKGLEQSGAKGGKSGKGYKAAQCRGIASQQRLRVSDKFPRASCFEAWASCRLPLFEAVFDQGCDQIECATCDDGKRTERRAGRNVGGRGSCAEPRPAFDKPISALNGAIEFLGVKRNRGRFRRSDGGSRAKACDFGGEPEKRATAMAASPSGTDCLKMASTMVAEAVLAVTVISAAEDSMSA